MKEKKQQLSCRQVAEPDMSHEEIAKELGVSRTRVAQIEREAIRKIRRNIGLMQ